MSGFTLNLGGIAPAPTNPTAVCVQAFEPKSEKSPTGMRNGLSVVHRVEGSYSQQLIYELIDVARPVL
jgi:hypothetical protein